MEVEDFNEKFKEVMDTRPIIGIPGIPTIEKYFNFNDSVSTEKQNWYMGIIEVSENTEEYLQKHTEIKFSGQLIKFQIIQSLHKKVVLLIIFMTMFYLEIAFIKQNKISMVKRESTI